MIKQKTIILLYFFVILFKTNLVKSELIDLTCNGNLGSPVCTLCLLGICLLQGPISLTVLTVLTNSLDLTVDLTLGSLLTINGDLTCDSTINLLGGVLVVNGAIELKSNCKFIIQNQAQIKSNATLTQFVDLSLTFNNPNQTGINTELTMGGNFDVVFKELKGAAPPRIKFLSSKVNITKTVGTTLQILPIEELSVDYANTFNGLSINNIVAKTLTLANSLPNQIISIPNAGILSLNLINVTANGINEIKSLINLATSKLIVNNNFPLTGSLNAVSSIVQITTDMAMVNINSASTTWLIQSGLNITNLFEFSNSIINITSSQLNLLGNGKFLNSPLQFTSSISQTLGISGQTRLINTPLPSTVLIGLDKLLLGNGGKLYLGETTSSNSIIYNLANGLQIQSLGGLLQTTGSILLSSQSNNIDKLSLNIFSLIVESGTLTLSQSPLLNIVDRVVFQTKGTLSLLQGSILNVGGLIDVGSPFIDLLLDNVNLLLNNAVLSIDNLELPNRLRVLGNSSISIDNISIISSSPLINSLNNINYVVVISDEDSVACNGQSQTPLPLGSSGDTTYQFICDDRMVAIRVVNCTGYTCNDGRCVESIANCPNSDGSCPITSPIKCWNGDCAGLFSQCKPLPPCSTDEIRCESGCLTIPPPTNSSISIGNSSSSSSNETLPYTCPECTNPLTCINPQTPFFGCPFGKIQCFNGHCANQLSECCLGSNSSCIPLASLARPLLAHTPIDSSKDITVPIIYQNSTLMDIYGYISLPNGFLSSLFVDKMRINRMTDNYLEGILGESIWGNSTTTSFRDVSVSFTFDLQLQGLLAPLFVKSIDFELKIPNINSYNLSDICLFFINTTSNSWQCMEESQLSLSSKGYLQGSTDHFTSFAVLLKSNRDSDDDGGGGGGDESASRDIDGDGDIDQDDTDLIKSSKSSSGITKTKLIIMVSSIVGGVVLVSIVAGIFIHYNIKHGGVKYWWKSKKRGLSISRSSSLNKLAQTT